MKIRKAMVGLFAAVLLVASMPASALSPNLITKLATGYYPSGPQTSEKYYECYLGGPRTSALAQLVYGSENYALYIAVDVWYYDPFSGSMENDTDDQIDYGTNSYNYTFTSSEKAAGAYVEDIEATYKIGPAQMAVLYTC